MSLYDDWAKEKGIDTREPAQVEKPKKKTGRGGWITSLISEAAGAVGGVGGFLLGGPLGAAAGAAAGSGLGNALEQKVRNEDTGVKWGSALGEGALSGAFAAAPVGKILKGVTKPITGGAKLLTRKIGGEVIEKGVQETGEKAAKSGLLSRVSNSLRRDVANPKVRAGVGGAQKEAEIAGQVSKVPGLSAKTKYKNLQSEMDGLTEKIKPILASSKKTVGTDELMTGIRKNAEQSSHFLAGDDLYEKQLSSVLTDITAKTGGTKKLTAQQIFDYKKGMDMDSVFKKLQKGADLNPKEAARLAVWSSLDDGITKAAPLAKELTKQQSLLMQGAEGLQAASKKTLGIPLLGIKSQRAEQVVQAGKELLGRGLQGGAGKVAATGGRSPLGMLARVGGADLVNPNPVLEDTVDPNSLDPSLSMGTDPATGEPIAAGMEASTGTPDIADLGSEVDKYEQLNTALEQAAIQALKSGDTKGLDNIMKVASFVEARQKAKAPAKAKKLTATQETRAVAAQNALGDMGMVEEAIASGKLGGAKALPFSGTAIGARVLGTEDLDAALFNIADNILRARSGAATPPDEVKRFVSNFLPRPTDSQEAKVSKLNRAKRELLGYLNPSATLDEEELTANLAEAM